MTQQLIVRLVDGVLQEVTSAPETDVMTADLYAELVSRGCAFEDFVVFGTPGLGLGVVAYRVGPEWRDRHVVVRHA